MTARRHDGERVCRSVCFIGGAPHSGSTLLGMVLGAHSDVFYGGELRKSSFVGDESKPLKKRVCKLCGPTCPVWSQFRPPFEPDVYEALARVTGASTVVDSGKGTDWQTEQLQRLEGTGVRATLVVLERDGRAVIASRLRKTPERALDDVIADWLTQIARTDAFAASFEGAVVRVRYEELASTPEPEVRRVTDALELSYEPAMLRFWEAEQHPLGGNDGTQFLVARERGRTSTPPQSGPARDVLDLAERNLAYYAPHPAAIVLDLRWQRELDTASQARFQHLAGRVNERFAWPRT